MTAGGAPTRKPGARPGPAKADRPTLWLVRHAKAVSRERWSDDDRYRPLTERGRRQARVLADHLLASSRRPSRILSSPATRCRETLLPLAEDCGLSITESDWLDEGSTPVGAFDKLRALTVELGGPSGDGGPVTAATHGDVMWGILDLLAGAGANLGASPGAPKGCVWILGFGDGTPPSASFFVPRPPVDREGDA